MLNDDVSYGVAEKKYYSIEHFIHEMEGRTGALIGADGAMYAIRSSLYMPLSHDTILDDFHISMNIIDQGYLLIHEKKALATEKNEKEVEGELRRKERIIAGGIQFLLRGGWTKQKNGLTMFKIFSHKILRWLTGPLFLTLVGSTGLAAIFSDSNLGDSLLFIILICGFGLALLGQWFPIIRRKIILINLIHYFFLLNLASLLGFYKGLTGGQPATWKANDAQVNSRSSQK